MARDPARAPHAVSTPSKGAVLRAQGTPFVSSSSGAHHYSDVLTLSAPLTGKALDPAARAHGPLGGRKARDAEPSHSHTVRPLTPPFCLCLRHRPAELQLSTSAKLLIRERDSRSSVRRQTIALKAHFVELEKQFLWTFRSLGDRPSLLMIPNHCISRRTLTLYACLRLIDGHEQELQREASGAPEDSATLRPVEATPSLAPILTLFSSIQDPLPLIYGAVNSLCGRIDRQTTRLFVIDHRTRTSPFAITLKTSLIQNTTSGGGAGAAAVLAALTPPSQHPGSSSASDAATAHSFIFVVKYHDDAAMRPGARVQKLDATLPQQWHTTLRYAHAGVVYTTAGQRLASADGALALCSIAPVA